MAQNKKISELTQTVTITGEELIPFVLDGENKTVKAKYLKGADNLGTDYVDLVGDDGEIYRAKVVNGRLVATHIDAYEGEDAVDEGKNPNIFTGLIINSMYGGGEAVERTPISHGFIE